MSLDNRVHFVAGLTMPRPKNTELRVYVVEYGREELMLRIKYPDGRVEHESSGSADRIEANRRAALREKELREKALQAAEATTRKSGKLWTDFRLDVRSQLIAGLALKTRLKYETTFNSFERHCDPMVESVDQITTQVVSKFVAAWRASGVADATLFGALGHFLAAIKTYYQNLWPQEHI